MAKKSRSKGLKSNTKTTTAKGRGHVLPASAVSVAKKELKRVVSPTAAAPSTERAAVAPSASEPKKVSQKLLETIEKRKKLQQANGRNPSPFGKPPGRRGRRPKGAVEYTPANQEEDTFSMDSDYEGIEYDTGIRLKEGAEDRSFSLDRFDDFDEELNFDR